MTTRILAGFQVAYTNDVASAVTAATLTVVSSSTFSFRYSIDQEDLNNYSSITVDPDDIVGSAPSIRIGDTEIALNDAEIAQIGWTETVDGDVESRATVMMRFTLDGVEYYFAMAGDALPAITSLAEYNAVIGNGNSFANSDSDSWSPTTMKPGNIVRPELALSYDEDETTEDDVIVGGDHDWSTTPLDTGAGADNVTGTVRADRIKLGTGNDTANGGAGNDRIEGEAGNDTIAGAEGNDTLQGSFGNDSLNGGADNDSLTGDQGDDSLVGGEGDDFISGGNATRTVSSNDTIDGGAGNDTLTGGSGRDSISGGDDNDRIVGGQGVAGDTGFNGDTLAGDAGNDTITGGDHADIIDGGTGNDMISAGGGSDSIIGGTGADSIVGGAGVDTISGGDAADTLRGGSQNDDIAGGTGNDSLFGDGGNDVMAGDAGADTMSGGSGNDDMTGGTENDVLNGLAGNDTLQGGADADRLNGGAGLDVLEGGGGSDTMTGGAGGDSFVFRATAGGDTVLDFNGTVDTLVLETSLGFTDFVEFRAALTVDGRVVTLDLGDDATIIFRNVSLAAFNAENVDFLNTTAIDALL